MTQETRSFQAEVSRLLEIVAHSLYSEKEIFLRELISNASDACDRLRYAALTEPALAEGDTEYRVTLTPDKAARTLTIADNGIGMNREELIDNLGTIARSGTAAFVNQLSGDARKDMSLIGQFGVGFYSAFMVAEKVEVLSRKAGESQGWRWVSDGGGEFTVEPLPDAARGARIVVHLREGEDEYLDPARLRRIVKTYSDHIGLPIILKEDSQGGDDQHRLRACGPVRGRKSPPSNTRSFTTTSATASTTLADFAQQGRGRSRIHEPSVCTVDQTVRFI